MFDETFQKKSLTPGCIQNKAYQSMILAPLRTTIRPPLNPNPNMIRSGSPTSVMDVPEPTTLSMDGYGSEGMESDQWEYDGDTFATGLVAEENPVTVAMREVAEALMLDDVVTPVTPVKVKQTMDPRVTEAVPVTQETVTQETVTPVTPVTPVTQDTDTETDTDTDTDVDTDNDTNLYDHTLTDTKTDTKTDTLTDTLTNTDTKPWYQHTLTPFTEQDAQRYCHKSIQQLKQEYQNNTNRSNVWKGYDHKIQHGHKVTFTYKCHFPGCTHIATGASGKVLKNHVNNKHIYCHNNTQTQRHAFMQARTRKGNTQWLLHNGKPYHTRNQTHKHTCPICNTYQTYHKTMIRRHIFRKHKHHIQHTFPTLYHNGTWQHNQAIHTHILTRLIKHNKNTHV